MADLPVLIGVWASVREEASGSSSFQSERGSGLIVRLRRAGSGA